jgi:transposase
MARYDLTDFEWKTIEPLLPNKSRGVPRVDDRGVLNGIFWVLRSGAPWADLPERYGSPTTIYNRFNRWRKAGVWDRLTDAIIAAHDGKAQMIDSTSVRVHQQAAAQKKQTGGACIGRSRGGLTTKLHARVVGNGLPVQLELSDGQANDAPMAELLLNDLPKSAIVLADRAYDADWIREVIDDQDCRACIPSKTNRTEVILYSRRTYKKRNLIERFFNKLKQFRHVCTRFDRRPLASIQQLVQPDLHGVRFDERMRLLADGGIVELTDHERHDQVALIVDGDALSGARAVLGRDVVEAGAAEQVGDADAAAGAHWREFLVKQVDVGHLVHFRIVDHAGLAVGAETELGPHIDRDVAVAPGPAGREAVAQEGPGRRVPAGTPFVHPRLVPVREG